MNTTQPKTWSATPSDIPWQYHGVIELSGGEYFEIYETPSRLVFGGACNAGFLESGYLEKEEDETPGEAMAELLAELETYYRDGAQYVSRILCNDRM